MHEGPLEPSAHLFSFGTWCKGNERTRVRGLTCTKSSVALGEKMARDLVQRKRRNKGQREFVHQVGAAPGGKIARGLVQRKRRNKG